MVGCAGLYEIKVGGVNRLFYRKIAALPFYPWSVTLDTEYVTVTSFNGSNATATTTTRTVLGDVQALNTTNVPYIETLMMTIQNGESHFNPQATLVRGTNGSVGTTSFPYG